MDAAIQWWMQGLELHEPWGDCSMGYQIRHDRGIITSWGCGIARQIHFATVKKGLNLPRGFASEFVYALDPVYLDLFRRWPYTS